MGYPHDLGNLHFVAKIYGCLWRKRACDRNPPRDFVALTRPRCSEAPWGFKSSPFRTKF